MKNFTTEDILSCLDKAAGNLHFPGFDNINYDMVTARLTGFRNDDNWALTIEEVVSWYSLNGVEPVLIISAFGSRLLINEPFVTYGFVRYPLNELQKYEDIPESISVMIRDEKLIVNSSGVERNPYISDYFDFDLMIYLVKKYRTQILATETELREIVPQELTKIIQLNNWHHPDVYNPNSKFFGMPSKAKSIQMIAQVLVSGKPELYQPCEENNVDWRKWIIK